MQRSKAQGLLGRQGVDAIGSITIPAEDRNRTSPFPYGGGRFEFRKSPRCFCRISQNFAA